MTPQIKARELVEKFISPTKQFDYQQGWQEDIEAAKACAIICVDESIAIIVSIIGSQKQFWTESEKDILVFYQSVREEILKIK